MRCDKRIDAAIELSLEGDTTVQALATHVGLSPSRFSHLFVLGTGVLPKEHLRILRTYRHQKSIADRILGEVGIAFDCNKYKASELRRLSQLRQLWECHKHRHMGEALHAIKTASRDLGAIAEKRERPRRRPRSTVPIHVTNGECS